MVCIRNRTVLTLELSLSLLCSQSNGDLKRKWTWAVEWLGDELERRPYTGNPQYTYNNWSPPVQSNETSNGYFLERSHSARMTLAKACELCPEEVRKVCARGKGVCMFCRCVCGNVTELSLADSIVCISFRSQMIRRQQKITTPPLPRTQRCTPITLLLPHSFSR